ncbi:tubulin delta chain isoform X2 [Austrofundulus limnaeus]|uniref:Tubulin delta chain n=1 Tax=Austrofundulus limnaeus TaxID=52670 RepID=A0A2I4BKI7_AUSLI|nr:PREDICTED: tubulin delta chain isoform X2 [Austrofundulus limnaeus]
MSVVTVQLGQCGNQVGQELFDTIWTDNVPEGQRKTYCTSSRDRFFRRTAHGGLQARAVLIDMEPKVINQSMTKAAKSGRWKYGETSHFSQKQGSGNNWANGYHVLGPRHRDVVEELVRREVESCDVLAGFMPMMSVAGGTGSGVGTFVTQCLRDIYPGSFILNHLTWPYGTGEVIVQNYNSVLTLAHLYQLSDAILVHENDVVHKICSQLLNIKPISFSDINGVIAHQLGGVLQPALTPDSHGAYGGNPLGELVSALACHPEYKLLSVCTVPQMPTSSIAFSTFSWPALLKHLRQMLISNSKMEEGGFADPSIYTSWLPSEEAFSLWKSPVPFNKYEKSATLVTNSQALLRPLDDMVRKAWNMFASRAYMHQYIKFGMSEEDFLDSFTSLEQVISSYSQLHS